MFKNLSNRAAKFVADNSPSILTSIGITGTVITAVLSGKASFKAATVIRDMEDADGYAEDDFVRLQCRLRIIWPFYVPTVISGATTILAIAFASHVGTRRAASIAAAYAISERTFEEYQNKVIEKIGAKKEQSVRDSVAQSRIDANPVNNREVIVTGTGEVLCYDSFTGRYFQSSMEILRRAENDINFSIINDMYASVTDFYNKVGLPRTSFSDEIGWKDGQKFKLDVSASISDDGRPCIHISFATGPVRDYYKFG